MAYDLSLSQVKDSFEPGEDLSAAQYLFVTQTTTASQGVTGTTRQVVRAGFDDEIVGIVENQVSGASNPILAYTGINGYQFPAQVTIAGVTKLAVDAAYAVGTRFAGATGTLKGFGTTATTALGNAKYARAVSMEPSYNAQEVITVRLIDQNPA